MTLVKITAANGQSLLLTVGAFVGGSWSSLATPYLCASSGPCSLTSPVWPSDVILTDEANNTVIELFSFDPSSSGNSGAAAVRCSNSGMFPVDQPPAGSYAWRIE